MGQRQRHPALCAVQLHLQHDQEEASLQKMRTMRVRPVRTDEEHQAHHGVGHAGARAALQGVLSVAHDPVELHPYDTIISTSTGTSKTC